MDWNENITLLKGKENVINSTTIKVYLEQILRLGSGSNYARCFKITSIIHNEISSVKATSISLSFHDTIPQNEFFDLEFFITSEKNYHGVAVSEWMDGEELKIRIDRVHTTNYQFENKQ